MTPKLTERQAFIFRGRKQGRTLTDIARDCKVGIAIIDTEVARVRKLLKVATPIEALRKIEELDLLGDDQPEFPWVNLTYRQLHIAHLVSRGYTNQEISQKLGDLGCDAIAYHIRQIRKKLGLHTRFQIAAAIGSSAR